MIFLVAVVCFAVFVIILNMDLISTIVLTLIIATFAIYLALAYRINKIRTINGQKHENEIINAVQMLIDHGNEIIEDKNLKSDQLYSYAISEPCFILVSLYHITVDS